MHAPVPSLQHLFPKEKQSSFFPASQSVSHSVPSVPQCRPRIRLSLSLSLSLSPLSLLVHLPNSRTDRWTHKRRKGLLPTDEAGSPPPLLLFVSPCEKCKSSEVVERGWFCGRGQAGGSRSLMPLIQLSGLALRTHPSFSPK